MNKQEAYEYIERLEKKEENKKLYKRESLRGSDYFKIKSSNETKFYEYNYYNNSSPFFY